MSAPYCFIRIFFNYISHLINLANILSLQSTVHSTPGQCAAREHERVISSDHVFISSVPSNMTSRVLLTTHLGDHGTGVSVGFDNIISASQSNTSESIECMTSCHVTRVMRSL